MVGVSHVICTCRCFGKWCGFVLSDKNKKALYIPSDFAHGYAVLSEGAEVYYKCSDFYSPEFERSIRWNDSDLSIGWPIKDPVLSKKDANAPLFKDAQLPLGVFGLTGEAYTEIDSQVIVDAQGLYGGGT